MVCWMAERPLQPAGRYTHQAHHPHGARRRTGPAYRIDVNTLHRDEAADRLALNEIGRVSLRLASPLFLDEYRRNRATGSFILIDESTNDTVGAGMVLGTQRRPAAAGRPAAAAAEGDRASAARRALTLLPASTPWARFPRRTTRPPVAPATRSVPRWRRSPKWRIFPVSRTRGTNARPLRTSVPRPPIR